LATVPCRHGTRHGRAVLARHCAVPRRAAVPAVPCLAVPWARPSAHDTAHGPFLRAVPPMCHGHFGRAVPAHGPSTENTQNQQKIPKSKFKTSNNHMSQNYKVVKNRTTEDIMKMIIKSQKSCCAMLPH